MQGITQDVRDILRGFKMTVDFNKLIFAFVGIVFSIIWLLVVLAFLSALGLIDTSPFVIINHVLISPRLGLSYLFSAFLSVMVTVDWAEYLGLVVLVVGLLAIWSIIGGAITRLAALEFARDEKIGFKEALSFASKKFWSYFWSPLTPALGVLFFVACNIIGGLFGQIKYIGEIAVAIGFPLAILSGFLIIFIGIIGVIGFFLMFPTISAEGSDAFDAMSRAYSYVISKPKHFISLFLGIIICGTIFAIFVSLAACLIMQTSFYTVGFGMGEKFESIKAVVVGGAYGKAQMASLGLLSMKFTALMLMIYIVLIKVAVGSLVVAFAGSASTIAYFLLRKDVDGTDINDVYIEEKEGEEEKREEEKEETKVETEKVETKATEGKQTAPEEKPKEKPKEKPPEEPGESSPEKQT
ncbi:MAG: hypothetical protein JYX80_05870 [Candidatus Scalindua sediminis]|nr:hypothetical protein [Candidatus Scalindua sediminis]HDY67533.1 hypothetical protein [Candidatus Scalindua sp.]